MEGLGPAETFIFLKVHMAVTNAFIPVLNISVEAEHVFFLAHGTGEEMTTQ